MSDIFRAPSDFEWMVRVKFPHEHPLPKLGPGWPGPGSIWKCSCGFYGILFPDGDPVFHTSLEAAMDYSRTVILNAAGVRR